MVVLIHIGFRHCGKKTISVIVDYTFNARQLNPTTVIYVLDVDLLDGGEIKNHWCIRFLVPIYEACSTSFHNFLEKFILRVVITDSVLSSIGAYELMVFQTRMDQFDFPKQQQTALDILKDFMILKSITVIEHDDLFFGNAIFNDEPDLAMFRYNKEKKIVSHENLDHDIKMQGSKGVLIIHFNRYFSTKHLLLYCIAPPRLCLHSLAPSPPPIIKSPKQTIVGQGTTIIYFNHSFTIIITTHCLFVAIILSVSPIPLSPRKRQTRMCEFIKPKKLAFEKEIRIYSKAANQAVVVEENQKTREPASRYILQAEHFASSYQDRISECGGS